MATNAGNSWPLQHNQSSKYVQEYSKYITATQSRTAEEDAAFLLPYIKKTDHILEVGCQHGAIATGLAKYASNGSIVGIDASTESLQKAKTLAAEAKVPTQGPGSIVFEQGNVLDTLPYPDNTFDIVYACQLFGRLQPPNQPLQVLAELRRVLKSGGILATRDCAAQHFFPASLDLDRLWVQNRRRALNKGAPPTDPTVTIMPAIYSAAGFDVVGGKVRVGAGTRVVSEPERRKWMAWRATTQLQQGEPLRQSWIDAGITEEEIQQTLLGAETWAKTDGSWYAGLECEIIAWK